MVKLLLLLPCLLALDAAAQAALPPDLEACIQSEQRSASAKSKLGSLLNSLAENLVNRQTEKERGGGAMRMSMGGGSNEGTSGPAQAYYGALDQCLTKQPAWAPASQLLPGADWDTMAAIHGYSPEQGPQARALLVDGPNQIGPGSELQLEGHLLLLTPRGEAAEVRIERKFFVRADGQEQELRFFGQAQETRLLPAGETVDVARLPIPRDLPAGVQFRYLLSVRVGTQAPSSTEYGVDLR